MARREGRARARVLVVWLGRRWLVVPIAEVSWRRCLERRAEWPRPLTAALSPPRPAPTLASTTASASATGAAPQGATSLPAAAASGAFAASSASTIGATARLSHISATSVSFP